MRKKKKQSGKDFRGVVRVLVFAGNTQVVVSMVNGESEVWGDECRWWVPYV